MGIINGSISTVVTYEVTLGQLRDLIAKDLCVPSHELTVSFKQEHVGDDRIGPTSLEVKKLIVTHKPSNTNIK